MENDQKIDVKSLLPEELAQTVREMGEPAYRASQLFDWMHRKKAGSFDEMTNLPRSFREKLRKRTVYTVLNPLRVQVSKLDGTRKYLFELSDGNCIESVFLPYHHGNSVCVSSQVGCRMGCRFCASTLGGLVRNLSAAEILDQIYRIEEDTGERVSNTVVMGSGEPMDNYENVVRFIRLLSAPEGLHMSQRNITVSTCGIVPGIQRFSREGRQATLALSLHASDDETRRKLMPIAQRYSIAEILSACGEFFRLTGRRVSYEYSVAAGVNDTPEAAEKLIRLLRGRHGHVNLIPVNPVTERSFTEPTREALERFRAALEKGGLNVTIRREMGRDIDGACGQLRRRYQAEQAGRES